jgi:hypothetical protein
MYVWQGMQAVRDPVADDGCVMDKPIPRRDLLIITAAMVFLVLAGALFDATHRDIRLGFDEVAQVSYIAAVQRDGPEPLTALRLLDPASFRFTAAPNYLNHPPLYYWALAAAGPHLEGQPRALLWYRIVNTLLAVLGLIACLRLGAGLGRMEFYAYAVPLVAMPVLVPLAGAINNDNAAFCGGAIAILALSRLVQTGGRRFLFMAAAGLIMAGWAKLTGLLLVGGVTTAVICYLAWRRRLPKSQFWTLAAALAVAAVPYLVLIAHYGSPAPDTAAQHAMLVSESRQYGWAAMPRLPFPAYAAEFVTDYFRRWLPGFVPQSPAAWTILFIPVLAVLIAALGIAAAVRRVAQRCECPADVLVVACALATAATFVVHIVFSYQRHLATGWMLDAYPRYYLPVALMVPLAGLSAALVLPGKWRATFLAALTLSPLIFLVLGRLIA